MGGKGGNKQLQNTYWVPLIIKYRLNSEGTFVTAMCDLGVLHSYLNSCNTTITEMISACVLISLRSETHHAVRFTSISLWGPSTNIINFTLWLSKILQYNDHEDDFRMHLRSKTHHAIHFTSFGIRFCDPFGSLTPRAARRQSSTVAPRPP